MSLLLLGLALPAPRLQHIVQLLAKSHQALFLIDVQTDVLLLADLLQLHQSFILLHNVSQLPFFEPFLDRQEERFTK